MHNVLEFAKHSLAAVTSFAAEQLCHSAPLLLATGSIDEALKTNAVLRERFKKLNTDQKDCVYHKVWELAKKDDPRIDGYQWGQEHAFDDLERLAKAMHRCGFLGMENVYPMTCLPYEFGEGGLGSQYFSLGEKLGKDPAMGQIGLINGMGMPTLEIAGWCADVFSNILADGNNIHCIYHSTHQNKPMGDVKGWCADVLRMKAVDGGCYTKTSYLAAQQIIDFLFANPDKHYLQVGVSEGGAHVNAALRLIQQAAPSLLSRICVLNFCPAYFILPEKYDHQVQVMNLVKTEDFVVIPWATNSHKIGHSENIQIIPHAHGDNPHDALNEDFKQAAKPYIDAFMVYGRIYV